MNEGFAYTKKFRMKSSLETKENINLFIFSNSFLIIQNERVFLINFNFLSPLTKNLKSSDRIKDFEFQFLILHKEKD